MSPAPRSALNLKTQSHLFQKDDLSPNLWLWYIAGRTQPRASFCILCDINADQWQGLELFFSESSKQKKREIGFFFWGKREGRDSRWHGRRFRVGARSDVMEAVCCLWTPRQSVSLKDLNTQTLKNKRIIVYVSLLALFFRTSVASWSLFLARCCHQQSDFAWKNANRTWCKWLMVEAFIKSTASLQPIRALTVNKLQLRSKRR